MNKSFTFNLLILVALNLLIKPAYLFGIEVGIQNSVGAASYGLYYAMFNFTFLFNVLLDLGINNFQKVNVAQRGTFGLSSMESIVPLKIGLSILYMAATSCFAWILDLGPEYWFFIGWMMVNQVLSMFLLLLRSNLGGLHLFMRDSVLSVLDRLILIFALGYLLWFSQMPFQIEWLVQFQAISYLIAIVVAYFMLPRGHRFHKLVFNFHSIKETLRSALPFAILILLMTLYNKVDGFMIERLATNGVVEAGIYAQAYRLLDAGNNFAFLFAGLLLPMFSKMLIQKRTDEVNKLIDQGSRLLIIPSALVLVWCYYYGNFMMDSLYEEHANLSSKSLIWLMGSFVFISSGYVFGTLLTASGNLRWLNITALVTVFINVGMNFVLIPIYGAFGAALSSFTSLAFMAVSQVAISRNQILKFEMKWMFKLVLIIVASAISGQLISLFELPPLFGLLLLIAISGLLFIVIGLKKTDFSEIFNMRSEAQ